MEKKAVSLDESYLCLSPLPVYLISTVSREGVYNIAPYGMVVPVSYKPLICCVGTSKNRDTYRNICEIKEFVAS